ncbi:hypothetical protein [Hugenholtzia roseola]|uniref:hypothetical protein n=1 Tax=Hugenholtzia roseola TaxID=1002 RepID=UPI0003FD104A|nr:hypothetical protein [Hugenholtzia roseola]
MKKYINILFLFMLFMACQRQEKVIETLNREFQIPVLIQATTPESFELAKVDSLSQTFFQFYGKHKFTDTLKLSERHKRDTTYLKDFIWEYPKPTKDDTLTTDGFQIFIDYQTNVYDKDEYFSNGNCYFPVYVVNETSRTKVFVGKDGRAFGIQEARDTSERNSERWRPIESKGFDFCGNGYFGLKVHPGEFVVFLVSKYSGNEKQLMRIRLQIGESLYISKSYEGTFDKRQFEIKKHNYVYKELQRNKSQTAHFLFYGAVPKGYDHE